VILLDGCKCVLERENKTKKISRYKDPLQKFLGWLLEGKSLDQEKMICPERR